MGALSLSLCLFSVSLSLSRPSVSPLFLASGKEAGVACKLVFLPGAFSGRHRFISFFCAILAPTVCMHLRHRNRCVCNPAEWQV